MSYQLWGALLGATAGLGLLLIVLRLRVIGRPQLSGRVLPYVRDLPLLGQKRSPWEVSSSPVAAAAGVFGPIVQTAARGVERVLGGAASVRRRLARAGIDKTVHEFRIEQVTWGLLGFAAAAAYGVLRTVGDAGNAIPSLLICAVGFSTGVLARDSYLSSQASKRERDIILEFPAVAELLALAVAAGEGPVAALDRVVKRSGGALSQELARVLAAVRIGEPVTEAFDRLARDTGLPSLARFAQGVAISVERGTPLAEVLHAQAADVRESGRRELIETAARKEVGMMVPVVFLVMPVTILFAFYPGYVGLTLTS